MDNEKNLPVASHSPLKTFGPDIRMTKGTYVPLNSGERKRRYIPMNAQKNMAPPGLINNSNFAK